MFGIYDQLFKLGYELILVACYVTFDRVRNIFVF